MAQGMVKGDSVARAKDWRAIEIDNKARATEIAAIPVALNKERMIADCLAVAREAAEFADRYGKAN